MELNFNFIADLSLDQIKRKLDLCNEMVETLSIFEPGISNSVLNCQFEQIAAKIMLFKRQSEDIENLMDELKKSFDLLSFASENKSLIASRFKRVKDLKQ